MGIAPKKGQPSVFNDIKNMKDTMRKFALYLLTDDQKCLANTNAKTLLGGRKEYCCSHVKLLQVVTIISQSFFQFDGDVLLVKYTIVHFFKNVLASKRASNTLINLLFLKIQRPQQTLELLEKIWYIQSDALLDIETEDRVDRDYQERNG